MAPPLIDPAEKETRHEYAIIKKDLSTGAEPLWRRDGRELFYLNPVGQVMAVAIQANASADFGVPRALFSTNLNSSPSLGEYGVTPDGERFLVLEPVGAPPPALAFVLNWRPDPAAK